MSNSALEILLPKYEKTNGHSNRGNKQKKGKILIVPVNSKYRNREDTIFI